MLLRCIWRHGLHQQHHARISARHCRTGLGRKDDANCKYSKFESHTFVANRAETVAVIENRTDEAVQGKRLGENEDKDHADKQLGLLRICPARSTKFSPMNKSVQSPAQLKVWVFRQVRTAMLNSTGIVRNSNNLPDASVAHNADGHPGCQAGKSASQASR